MNLHMLTLLHAIIDMAVDFSLSLPILAAPYSAGWLCLPSVTLLRDRRGFTHLRVIISFKGYTLQILYDESKASRAPRSIIAGYVYVCRAAYQWRKINSISDERNERKRRRLIDVFVIWPILPQPGSAGAATYLISVQGQIGQAGLSQTIALLQLQLYSRCRPPTHLRADNKRRKI